MNDVSTELQPNLWPDWVAKHPWLISLLAKAEAEARNRGDTYCDHFHIELAFLSLGPPVRDWLETLGLDARLLREDVVEILGMNAKADVGEPKLEAFVARGQRARAARSSSKPGGRVPLGVLWTRSTPTNCWLWLEPKPGCTVIASTSDTS